MDCHRGQASSASVTCMNRVLDRWRHSPDQLLRRSACGCQCLHAWQVPVVSLMGFPAWMEVGRVCGRGANPFRDTNARRNRRRRPLPPREGWISGSGRCPATCAGGHHWHPKICNSRRPDSHRQSPQNQNNVGILGQLRLCLQVQRGNVVQHAKRRVCREAFS